MATQKLSSVKTDLACPICAEESASLPDHVQSLHSQQEVQQAILRDKAVGVADIEIGRRYGVTYRYIEKLITEREGVNISQLGLVKKVKRLAPKDFQEEQTSVWSFKSRGNWATHSGEYRGNWSPYIPRNVILKYSKEGETVLDYFCGAGTTAVEAKLLGRKCIASDVNDGAIKLARENIAFEVDKTLLKKDGGLVPLQVYEPSLRVGDARDLSFLKDNSIDLICAHPPYANIINYTQGTEGDLSHFEVSAFLEEIKKVAEESFRVLKSGHQCAILIGDTRQKKHVVPMGFGLIKAYLDAGFKLKELVIKRQHNCKTTGFWYTNSVKYNFLLLAHEYLPIFEKPLPNSKEACIKKIASAVSQIQNVSMKPLQKKKPEALESTTVWVLPEDDYEKRLNKNVIDRYSASKNYITVSLSARDQENKKIATACKAKEARDLVFIKSVCLVEGTATRERTQAYLDRITDVFSNQIEQLATDGFLVVRTRDVRFNGCLEPVAKRIVGLADNRNMKLREVIVVTSDGAGVKCDSSYDGRELRMTHEYLLVYRKL